MLAEIIQFPVVPTSTSDIFIDSNIVIFSGSVYALNRRLETIANNHPLDLHLEVP